MDRDMFLSTISEEVETWAKKKYNPGVEFGRGDELFGDNMFKEEFILFRIIKNKHGVDVRIKKVRQTKKNTGLMYLVRYYEKKRWCETVHGPDEWLDYTEKASFMAYIEKMLGRYEEFKDSRLNRVKKIMVNIDGCKQDTTLP